MGKLTPGNRAFIVVSSAVGVMTAALAAESMGHPNSPYTGTQAVQTIQAPAAPVQATVMYASAHHWHSYDGVGYIYRGRPAGADDSTPPTDLEMYYFGFHDGKHFAVSGDPSNEGVIFSCVVPCKKIDAYVMAGGQMVEQRAYPFTLSSPLGLAFDDMQNGELQAVLPKNLPTSHKP